MYCSYLLPLNEIFQLLFIQIGFELKLCFQVFKAVSSKCDGDLMTQKFKKVDHNKVVGSQGKLNEHLGVPLDETLKKIVQILYSYDPITRNTWLAGFFLLAS